MKSLRRLAVAVCVVVVLLTLVFTVGLRRKSPAVLDAIRRMNRTYLNPRQRDAGTRGAYASLIRHSGRRSGATYETPIVAASTGDGFVIALPYGTRADWLRNVLAAGSATITHEGVVHRVVDPEVVPTKAANQYFSAADRRAHRIFGTDECLVIRHADTTSRIDRS